MNAPRRRVAMTFVGLCVLLPVRASAEEAVKPQQKSLTIEHPNLFPESFAWDAKHGRFIVGSATSAKLIAISEQGKEEEFVLVEEVPEDTIVLGVKVDLTRNRVLALLLRMNMEEPLAALVAYDLDSKKRLLFARLDEVDAGKQVGNDVAVDADGNAYVTNARGNSIWKVNSSGERSIFVALPQKPVLDGIDEQKECDLNGIVYHNGNLIVAQTNSGVLFRVKLSDKKVGVVQIADGLLFPGADGMAVRPDGSLVLVTMSKAWLFTTKNSWLSAKVIDSVELDKSAFTTSVTVRDSRVFTLQSHILDLFRGENVDNFDILEIEFPADSHDDPIWLLVIVGLFAVPVLAWKFQMREFNKAYTKKRV